MSAKGWSVFWRKDKKQFVLSYATATGPKQKLVPRKITVEGEATKWARSWLDEQNLRPGEVLEQRRASGPKLGELAPQWYAHRARIRDLEDIAPSTYADNKSHIETHVLPVKLKVDGREVELRDLPIAAIDVPFACEYVLKLRERCTSVSRTRNVFYSMRTFYADAMSKGWVNTQGNVFDHPNVKRLLPESGSDREDEASVFPIWIAQLLISSAKVPIERRLRYMLLFTTSARDGEISGWAWRNFADEEILPTMATERALRMRSGIKAAEAPADRSDRLGKTKSRAGRRTNPLHPEAVRALREWRRGGWIERVGREPKADDPIFPGIKKLWVRPPSARLVREDLIAVADEMTQAGEEKRASEVRTLKDDVVFHTGRHSLNTWLANAGVPKLMRQRLLGHAGEDVTDDRYTGKLALAIRDALAALPLRWGLVQNTRTVTSEGQNGAENGKPSHEDAPSHSLDADHENADDTVSGSHADEAVQGIAKPSYVGSNPIHASVKTQVTTAKVTTESRVTQSDLDEPPGADEPPSRIGAGAVRLIVDGRTLAEVTPHEGETVVSIAARLAADGRPNAVVKVRAEGRGVRLRGAS